MAGGLSEVEVLRVGINTDDPELAHHFSSETYSRYRSKISTLGERFRFSLSTAVAGRMAVDTVKYSIGIDAKCEPLPQLTAAWLSDRTVELRHGRHEERFGPGEAVLYPYGVGFDARLRGADQTLLRLDFASVAQLAAQQTGIDEARFRFLGMQPISPAMGQYWRTVTMLAYHELAAGPSRHIHPLMLTHTEAVLAAAALSVFPNTTMTAALPAGEGRVPSTALRRAVAYIDAHAAEPITLADIAAGADVPARALRRAFADHHQTTPMAYLRQVRLEHAHHDLQAADPQAGLTAAQIARRWGFAQLGRFAALYRSVYGVDPAKTLRS